MEIRWAKDWGLSEMGFGREKTTYCYFAVAASCSLPYGSDIRMMVAKSAIIITVADDFFDMKASLDELTSLTHAIRRYLPIFVLFFCFFVQRKYFYYF